MSTNETQFEGTGQTVHDEITEVGTDVGKDMGESVRAATGTGPTGQISDALENAKEEAKEDFREMRSEATSWLHRIDDMARENPGAALVGAAITGFVLGALIRAATPERSAMRHYMGETTGWLASIFRPIGKGAQRAYEASTDVFRVQKRKGFFARLWDMFD